jgi:hypothetical protein
MPVASAVARSIRSSTSTFAKSAPSPRSTMRSQASASTPAVPQPRPLLSQNPFRSHGVQGERHAGQSKVEPVVLPSVHGGRHRPGGAHRRFGVPVVTEVVVRLDKGQRDAGCPVVQLRIIRGVGPGEPAVRRDRRGEQPR